MFGRRGWRGGTPLTTLLLAQNALGVLPTLALLLVLAAMTSSGGGIFGSLRFARALPAEATFRLLPSVTLVVAFDLVHYIMSFICSIGDGGAGVSGGGGGLRSERCGVWRELWEVVDCLANGYLRACRAHLPILWALEPV